MLLAIIPTPDTAIFFSISLLLASTGHKLVTTTLATASFSRLESTKSDLFGNWRLLKIYLPEFILIRISLIILFKSFRKTFELELFLF